MTWRVAISPCSALPVGFTYAKGIDDGNEPNCHREPRARGPGWLWQHSEPVLVGRIKFDAGDNTVTGSDTHGLTNDSFALTNERSHSGMDQP